MSISGLYFFIPVQLNGIKKHIYFDKTLEHIITPKARLSRGNYNKRQFKIVFDVTEEKKNTILMWTRKCFHTAFKSIQLEKLATLVYTPEYNIKSFQYIITNRQFFKKFTGIIRSTASVTPGSNSVLIQY